MDISTYTQPATLLIEGTTFHVTAFQGIEAINTPFRFEVSFFSKDVIRLSSCPTWATLIMPTETQTTRQWQGQINAFSSTEMDNFVYQYQLVIKHPLHQLHFYQQAQQFFGDNELSLAIDLLNKHQLEFELLGIEPEYFETKPLIQQFSYQNDFDFFHHLLAKINVQYAIQPSNKISLFLNPKLLPNAAISCLYYLPDQKQWVDSVPHFYDYHLQVKNNHPTKVEIKSGLSHLGAGEQLSLSLDEYDKHQPHYLIKEVQHRYEIEETGYENTVTLSSFEALPSHDIKHSDSATHLTKGKIESAYSHANLDENGHYQYHLENTQTPKQHQSQQPYAPRLTPLAGKLNMGLHFPLQNSDEIFMAYTNAHSQNPIILANTSSPYQSAYASMKYKAQSVIAASDDLSLRLDDTKDNECIQLNARHNVCLWTNDKDNPRIHFASPHNISFKAVKNISCKSNNSELIGHNTASIQVKQNIEHHIQENYFEQVNENVSLQATTYETKAEHHIQIQCEQLTLAIEKNIEFSSSDGSLKFFSADTLNIDAGSISIDSGSDLEIGTASAFIQKKQNQLHMRADKLRMSNNDTIHYVGEIDQQSAGANRQPNSPSLTATLYPHKTIESKTTQKIDNLSWKNCAPQIDTSAIATFTMDGYKKGERGYVTIYQCTAENEALINPASLAEKSNNETYQEIARIKFKIMDEKNNHLEISWQPKSLPENKTEKLVYYRFSVEIKGEAEPTLSKAMQWFSTVELKHKGKANVAAFKIERRILPSLRYIEPQKDNEDPIDIIVPRESTQAFKDETAFIEHVPLNVSNKIYLLSEDEKIKEVISQDFRSVGPYQIFKLSTLKTNLQHEIYSLKEPIILNLNTVEFEKETNTPSIQQKQDENSRLLLTEAEINYFKENGNNITIFIHGFNVPYGQFSKKIISSKLKPSSENFAPKNHKGHALDKLYKFDTYDENCYHTIKQHINYEDFYTEGEKSSFNTQDKEFEVGKSILYINKVFDEQINAQGMHNWVVHFEDNLNRAAGFKDDYREFSRALFIAWPGEPNSPADYMEANAKSKKMGRAFAEVLLQLRKFSRDMEINIIAHSQGNGVMLSALDYIGELDNTVMVDHVFAWQAAIPYTALNGVQGMTKQPAQYFDGHVKRRIDYCRKVDPWFLPFAHLACKNINVLYSHNDNIVGKVTEQQDQKEGVSEEQVFKRKPLAEFLAGVFTTYLELGSLYEAANQLGFPASDLLEEDKLEPIWSSWVNTRSTTEVAIYDDKNKFVKYIPLEKTLKSQANKLGTEDFMYDFCHQMAQRILKNKSKINEKLSWLSGMDYIIGASAKSLLQNLDSIEDSFVQKFSTKSHKNISIPQKIASTEGFFILAGFLQSLLYHHKIKSHIPWLVKLFTFVYCAELANSKQPIHGMGWHGVDLNNSNIGKMFRSGYLKNTDCSAWVFEHSDMKIPSRDILDFIYKDEILDAIKFGKYPKIKKGK